MHTLSLSAAREIIIEALDVLRILQKDATIHGYSKYSDHPLPSKKQLIINMCMMQTEILRQDNTLEREFIEQNQL